MKIEKILPIIAFVFLSFTVGLNLFTPKTPQAQNFENFVMPKFEGTLLNGKNFSNHKLNERIVVYNFFASWCTPCLEEHPYIKKLKSEHKLRIIGVAWKDSKENIEKWLKKNGNPYSDVILDSKGDISVLFGITGLPQTYIFDNSGKLIFFRKGAITEDIYKNSLIDILK